jgi:dTDP-L-rhamnose 4-epimerase
MRPPAQLAERKWEVSCPNCDEIASPAPTDEGKPLHPTTVYAITKRDQEELCMEVGRAYGIPVVALRYFNVLGPGQSLKNPYTGVCAIFSSRIRDGKPPVIYEDGRQTRDIVSVRDIVQGNILAMNDKSMDYGVYNVGTGKAISILEVAEELIRLHDVDLKPSIPGKFRAGDIRHCFADISRLSSHGYEPVFDFENSIREFFEWSQGQPSEDMFDRAEGEMDSRGLVI